MSDVERLISFGTVIELRPNLTCSVQLDSGEVVQAASRAAPPGGCSGWFRVIDCGWSSAVRSHSWSWVMSGTPANHQLQQTGAADGSFVYNISRRPRLLSPFVRRRRGAPSGRMCVEGRFSLAGALVPCSMARV